MTTYAKNVNDKAAKIKYEIDTSIWIPKNLSTERKYIDYKWENSDCGTLMYGSFDIYNELSSNERAKLTRSQYNDSTLTDSDLFTYEDLLKNNDFHITDKEYINFKMKILKFVGTAKYNNYFINYVSYITINNGYEVQWQYYGEQDTICLNRLNNIISTMESTNTAVSTSYSFDAMKILLGIVLTAICYLTYPFVQIILLKKKYDSQSLKTMALWNSMIIGIIFLIYTCSKNQNISWSAGPAIFYYWMNMSIWPDRKKSRITKLNNKRNFIICSNCGCKILKKFSKCPKCGKEIRNEFKNK